MALFNLLERLEIGDCHDRCSSINIPYCDKILRGLNFANFGQIRKDKSTQNVTFALIRKN